MRLISLAFITLILLSIQSVADEDFSKEVEKATPLTSQISMIEGAGGNVTALIGAECTLLVDDDFAPMAEKLVAKLKELHGDRPRFIINTHFHYDHTGGNEIFGSTSTIIAANEVRKRLMTEQVLWGKNHPPEPKQALPILTFDNSLTLHLNDEEIKIVHLPHGHTDGDSVVFFTQNKVVALGDLYFSGMYPIFHPEHEGSLSGLVQDLKWILKEIPSDAQIVPGHGPLSKRSELEQYYQMILASIAVVKEGIRNHKTLTQIQKKGLPSKWEPFSHGYRTTDQWLQSLYQSMQNEI